MNAAKTLLAVLVLLGFGVRTLAAGPAPRAVLDALPTEKALGGEWSREIAVLIDPFSTPPEIVHTSSPLPESFKEELCGGVKNPKGEVSGWSHVYFARRTGDVRQRYTVQFERYREIERLRMDFDQFLAIDSEKYHKHPVKDLGDVAVFFTDAQGQGATLWFRRGHFRVWIDPANFVTHWQKDTNLEHLARMLDDHLKRGSDKPDALPESEGRQDRLPARTTEPQAGLLEGGASHTQQAPESPLSVLFLGYTNGMGASVVSNQCSRTVKVWAAAWVEVEPFSETRSDDWIWVIGPRDQYLDPGRALYWTFSPPAHHGTWRLRIPWSEEDRARIIDWARRRQIGEGLRAAPEYYAASAAIEQ